MKLILRRSSLGPISTQGRLFVGAIQLYTIEDRGLFTEQHPWGVPFQSCIPAGTYDLVPHSSPARPNTWAIVNPALGVYRWPADVPDGRGRFTCLLHPGNTDDDVEGCIVMGLRSGIWKNKPAVFESQKAMALLRRLLVPGTTGHTIEIVDPPLPEKCRVA